MTRTANRDSRRASAAPHLDKVSALGGAIRLDNNSDIGVAASLDRLRTNREGVGLVRGGAASPAAILRAGIPHARGKTVKRDRQAWRQRIRVVDAQTVDGAARGGVHVTSVRAGVYGRDGQVH